MFLKKYLKKFHALKFALRSLDSCHRRVHFCSFVFLFDFRPRSNQRYSKTEIWKTLRRSRFPCHRLDCLSPETLARVFARPLPWDKLCLATLRGTRHNSSSRRKALVAVVITVRRHGERDFCFCTTSARRAWDYDSGSKSGISYYSSNKAHVSACWEVLPHNSHLK